MNRIGKYAPDFEIPGTDGQVHHLGRYFERYRAVAVVFMANHCPQVGLYLDRLKALQAEFEPQGATIMGISANDPTSIPEDSFDAMKAFSQTKGFNFPYLWDSTQDVAESFGVGQTPEVFLIDSGSVLRYIGAIDDNPQNPAAVRSPYLRSALAAVLANQEPPVVFTKSVGSPIAWRSGRGGRA